MILEIYNFDMDPDPRILQRKYKCGSESMDPYHGITTVDQVVCVCSRKDQIQLRSLVKESSYFLKLKMSF